MASISTTFNDLVNQQAFLIALIIWISVAIEAVKKDNGAKSTIPAKNIVQNPVPKPPTMRAA